MKRYHEAPISIFDEVKKVTDGDYALVHLFESNQRYFEKFKQSVKEGRDVILDNSLFELRTAFDDDRFARWVKVLCPTWYIVPDSWKNGKETTRMFFNFIEKHKDLPGKRIGVAQGNTVEEVAECYKSIEPYCDMIAFNLDFSSVFYDLFPSSGIEKFVPRCVAMSYGRPMVLSKLKELGVINEEKPHHLLGCGVPQEVLLYPSSWGWVRSIDTSNPVMMGLKKYKYPKEGPSFKPGEKMCDLVNDEVNSETLSSVLFNIACLQDWCNER